MEVLIVIWIAMGFLAAWIAAQKKRGPAEGFILGFVFGPLGVIVEALLPSQQAPIAGRPASGLRGSKPSPRGRATQAEGDPGGAVPQDVLDALGIEEEKPPTTNEEFIRRLKGD